MPPKRKDNNSTSAASGSGPKPKRSKPTFRTPTSATAQSSESTHSANQLTSSNNRVVTLRTGASGRRGYRTQELAASSSNDACTVDAYEHISPADYDITGPASEIQNDIQNDIPAVSKGRAKQKNTTTSKLNKWLAYRQTCLYELLRHDGLADSLNQKSCWSCGNSSEVVWKCLDCSDGGLLRCQTCLVASHACHPLHRIEKWDGYCFQRSSLQMAGLRFQLGHGGAKCISPTPGPTTFTVTDTSGIHYIAVDFCDCRMNGTIPRHIQLLRAGWFPATFIRPQTVFTFKCLDFYHELTLQGKVNAYDFCRTLHSLTDSLELNNISNHLTEFQHVVRIWRHILMLKRSGRGHDPNGVDATLQGELGIECPACPHPDRNLPDNWDKESSGQYRYTLFLGVDGNFKLRLKERGITDPELAPGGAYFVEEKGYQAFIKDYVNEPEINTCQSEHDALVRAAVRCTPGYKVTGVILVICPRHGLVRRNGAGDLQKGEKFCNMDYVILSAVKGERLHRIVLTYDIGCQYSKNFKERMLKFPADMHLDENLTIEFGVPSWHINAHGADCRADFGLGFRDGVGRTCGEEVEVTWASTNLLGPSTREMGPGARHETLNAQWGGMNFRRIIVFRQEFLRHLKEALDMRKKHRQLFQEFTDTFRPETTNSWQKLVDNWRKDRSQPNPYLEPGSSSTTLQDVRLELAKEDSVLVAQGEMSPHITSLTSFLMVGLDIEEQQRVISYEINVMKKYETQKQLADLEEKRRILMARINQWRQVQLAYIPAVGPLVANVTSQLLSVAQAAERIPLFLPSSLSSNLHNTTDLFKPLSREVRLQFAQADDALHNIQHHLRIISGLWRFKKVNISGTGNCPNTHMRTLFSRFNHRLKKSVLRYQAAYTALLAADPGGEWKNRLKNLQNSDVRGPGKDDFYIQEPGNQGPEPSKGRFEISWIWLVPRSVTEVEADSSEQVLDEGMRIEWSKSQARKMRWEEEVELIQEEMRRTIVYYEWKVSWWLQKNIQHPAIDDPTQHGIAAYAQKQAYYCKCLAESFASTWLPYLQSQGIIPDWGHRYVDVISTDKKNPRSSTGMDRTTLYPLGVCGEDMNSSGTEGEEQSDDGYEKNLIKDAFEFDD